MKKTNVLIFCVVWVIIFSLLSCGARKSTVGKSKEETKIETVDNSMKQSTTETNVKTETTTKVDDKNETVTEETTISPEDNTKEAFIIEKDGTKTVLNNAKKTVKKTTQKNNTKSEAKQHVNSDIKSNIKEQKAVKHTEVSKKETKAKQVDKKQFNPFNLVWIGSLVLLVLWCVYRIYKKLPLAPKF